MKTKINLTHILLIIMIIQTLMIVGLVIYLNRVESHLNQVFTEQIKSLQAEIDNDTQEAEIIYNSILSKIEEIELLEGALSEAIINYDSTGTTERVSIFTDIARRYKELKAE